MWVNLRPRTIFSSIPFELQQANQWLNWGQNANEPKQPSTPTNGFQGWQQHLSSFGNVKVHAEVNGLGIGFAFRNQTEFFGIDLDGCIDPSTGAIEPWAYAIVVLASSYCEMSPSRTGLKIICRGHANANLKKIVFGIAKHGNHKQQVEFKTISGYFALTGYLHPNLPAYPVRVVDPFTLHSRIKLYKRCLAYLVATPPAIEGQGGDPATFTLACALIHGFDLTPSESLILIAQWNQRCVPPWSERELQHKFDEANKREDGNGRPRGYMLNQDKVTILQSVTDYTNQYFPDNACNEKTNQQPSDKYIPFPTDLLPEPLSRFVREASTAICCDASFVALPLLSALAAAIGDSRRLFVRNDWRVPAIIWTAVIGESGTAKSPAFRCVVKHAKQRQELLQQTFAEQQLEYERQRDIYESELKRWKNKRLWLAGEERPTESEKPPHSRTTTSDCTLEALVGLLIDNLKGLLAEFDELASWFGSHDRYRQGADSATWLSIYNGDSITVDRKGSGHSFVPAAYVSITGGIQPGLLYDCFTSKHRASGLMARFLMAHPPRQTKVWTDNELTIETDSLLSRVFGYCYGLEPQIDANGKRTAYEFELSPEAKQLWVPFYDRHNQEQLDTSGTLAASFSKLEEYPLRFAIVFHRVKQSIGLALDHQIDADTMRSSIALTEWFKNESRRINTAMAFDSEESEKEKLVAFIASKGGAVKPRHLQRSNGKRYPNAKVAEAALNGLVTAGNGVWEQVPPSNKGGRPSKQFRLTTPE